jgi:hypothetical protein
MNDVSKLSELVGCFICFTNLTFPGNHETLSPYRISTILKVFDALQTKIVLAVKMN